jgi:CHAT domain-containing protein
MAGQRYSFFTTMEWVLGMLSQWVKRVLGKRLSALFLVVLFVLAAGIGPVRSQQSDQGQLVRAEKFDIQAKEAYKKGDYLESIRNSKRAVAIFESQGDWQNQATSLTNLGISQLAVGQPEEAFKSWSITENIYIDHLQTQKNIAEEGIVKNRIYQSQALKDAGLYDRACNTFLSAIMLDPPRCIELDKSEEAGKDKISSWEKVTSALDFIKKNKNQYIKGEKLQALVWRSFGETLYAVGKLEESEFVLEEGVKNNHGQDLEEIMHLSLANTLKARGNLERDRQLPPQYNFIPWRYNMRESRLMGKTDDELEDVKLKYEKAFAYYKSAIDKYSYLNNSKSPIVKVQSKINQLGLLIEKNEPGTAQKMAELTSEIKNLLSTNSNTTRSIAYTRIHFAKNLAYLKQIDPRIDISWEKDIIGQLELAHQLAKTLNDNRLLSYFFGSLGGLYEFCSTELDQCGLSQLGNLTEKAKWNTDQALLKSQPGKMPDLAYQWQWQLGRLFESSSNIQSRTKAIENYKEAINTLRSVRSNLLSIDSDMQFSFRDNVEPLYRQLVGLLLEDDSSKSALRDAVELIDELQITELDNFLRCNILQNIGFTQKVEPTVATFYTASLENRLEVVVKLPNNEILHPKSIVGPIKIKATDGTIRDLTTEQALDELRKELEQDYLPAEGTSLSPLIYKWLISSNVEAALKQQEIKTLVFILDGSLRNIPVSALYNGNHYLIEDYAVALTPSLRLPQSQPISKTNLSSLVFGLYQKNENSSVHKDFGALRFVESEMNNIKMQISDSQLFPNNKFSDTTLRDNLSDSSAKIVHFATHGEFSSDPKQTFILSWDKKVDSFKLRKLLRRRNTAGTSPIDLLVLSACKTADGDRRAVLGLAGIGLQSGVRSTVASLWVANDQSTSDFMNIFYQSLNDKKSNLSRSEALRRAQINFIRDKKFPRDWAPFVLVGNWN